MRLEHFDAHLNELIHDLASPLNSMRLQLGLLRDALKTEERLTKRVESTERQVVRAQRMMDAFVAACRTKSGRTVAGPVIKKVMARFRLDVIDKSSGAEIGITEKTLVDLITSVAEGCTRLVSPTLSTVVVVGDSLVLRVEGDFDKQKVARALRLSYVDDDGEPELALATSRLAAAAANGTLLLERDALVIRLPLVTE